MKTLILTSIISILILINAISQDIQYRKDDRPQNVKEDRFNNYQRSITEIELLKVLELLGVRIFDIPIFPAFEREYKLSVYLNEYVEGKKINSDDIIYTHQGKNVYIYWEKDLIEQKDIRYFDYIPKLSLFSKDNDTTMILNLDTYASRTLGIKLNKKKTRNTQSYDWRTYSKVDWKLNEEVPLLVYASSWYDEVIKSDRFCGVSDLSEDEEATKELLDKSPHYYVISLKVFE